MITTAAVVGAVATGAASAAGAALVNSTVKNLETWSGVKSDISHNESFDKKSSVVTYKNLIWAMCGYFESANAARSWDNVVGRVFDGRDMISNNIPRHTFTDACRRNESEVVAAIVKGVCSDTDNYSLDECVNCWQ